MFTNKTNVHYMHTYNNNIITVLQSWRSMGKHSIPFFLNWNKTILYYPNSGWKKYKSSILFAQNDEKCIQLPFLHLALRYHAIFFRDLKTRSVIQYFDKQQEEEGEVKNKCFVHFILFII